MVRALFDTNILIDCLNGRREAAQELDRWRDRAISRITWMEVLVGAPPDHQVATRAFLAGFAVVEISVGVAERAVELRRSEKLKLPDAIVLASARAEQRVLVTRDTRAFSAAEPDIHVPYA